MLIGVPKEIKNSEFRVGLTPASVRELIARGHAVLVETGAGAAVDMSDADYRGAGAALADQGWRRALVQDRHLAGGLNIADGKLVHREVARSLGLPFEDPARLFAGAAA